MAFRAARFDRLVFDLGFVQGIVMAFEAEGLAGFLDQELVGGGMGNMTFRTARLDGGMLDLGLGERIVMAVQAEGFARQLDQEFVRGAVRFVAGAAFAVLGRGVFDLGLGQKILMTRKTYLPLRPLHPDRVLGLMAFQAAFLIVRRMLEEDPSRSRGCRGSARVGLPRGAGNAGGRSIGARVGVGHAIEEEGEPLVVFLGRATGQGQQQQQGSRGQAGGGRSLERRQFHATRGRRAYSFLKKP